MNRTVNRTGLLSNILISAAAVLLSCAGHRAAANTLDREVTFRIESQALDMALLEFSKQANVQLMLAAKSAGAQQSPGISGRHAVNRALASLLKGTGLTYTAVGNTITIEPDAASSSSEAGKASTLEDDLRLVQAQTASKAGDESSASAKSSQSPGTSGAEGDDSKRAVAEITVTATKRAESIQDVPVSITALSGDEMEKRGMSRMSDYLRTLPGVNLLDLGNGLKRVIFRGIATDPEIETLTSSTYFGEVPISAAIGSGVTTGTDLRMVDMERIEVLRGPQGTLYGSGAMGGMLRQIPRKPDLQTFSGEFGAGYSNTARLGGDNYSMHAAVNLPLAQDKLALRLVGYRYFDSGFYENVAADNAEYVGIAQTYGGVARNQSRVGDDTMTGGRLAASWHPTERLAIDYMYVQQRENGGQTEGLQGLGDYQQTRLQVNIAGERGGPTRESEVKVNNLTFDYDLGWANILSSSSWVKKDVPVANFDVTVFFAAPVSAFEPRKAKTFSQELRLSSKLDGPLQFIGGLYYEDIEDDAIAFDYWSGDPALNIFGTDTQLYRFDANSDNTQKAVFGELAYALTEQLTATVGGRYYDYDQRQASMLTGIFGDSTTDLKSAENGTTFKASIDYVISERAMIYAQWAEGFRLGSPLDNTVARSPTCDANGDGLVDGLGIAPPNRLDSDSLENYELGAKIALRGGRLVLNTAVYRINWQGIPLSIRAPVGSLCTALITLNAGKAVSQGLEFEGRARLTDGLKVDFGATYTRAELAEDAPNLGSDGDRLPGTPEYKFNLGMQYDFAVNRYAGFARADYAYVTSFSNSVVQDTESSDLKAGGYSQVNVRAGLGMNNLTGELYVDNLLNEDAYSWVGLRYRGTIYYLRPRTVGLNIKYKF